MTIKRIVITKDELKEAIQGLLKTRGIDVIVTNVESLYSSDNVEIDCDVKGEPSAS